MDFTVSGGQVNDCTQAVVLLGERKAEWVMADKGYDSKAIRAHIAAMGAVAVVPSLSSRRHQHPHDKDLYRKRNRIERCFSKLKHLRRFATRYEKLNRTSKLSSPSHAHGYISSYMSIRPRPNRGPDQIRGDHYDR